VLHDAGKEVVIEPSLERLKAHGLAARQLECLRWRRLDEKDWTVEIEGKKVNLADVAKLTVRDLVASPFAVELLDGRTAQIAPDVKQIERYWVSGEYFEFDVRQQLQSPFCQDPAERCVLAGVPVPGGQVPNAWGRDRVHISIGEPLKIFAKVEIHGKPGPQAADLAHMLAVDKCLETGLQLGVGMSRSEFEKRFGPGKKLKDEDDPHFKSDSGWQYPLGKGNLLAWFNDEGAKVSHVSAWHGQPWPEAPSPDCGRLARAVAGAERDLLFSFLKKRFSDSPVAEKKPLRAFLEKTAIDLQWTDKERKQMLGD
jgi:hypothetical protein